MDSKNQPSPSEEPPSYDFSNDSSSLSSCEAFPPSVSEHSSSSIFRTSLSPQTSKAQTTSHGPPKFGLKKTASHGNKASKPYKSSAELQQRIDRSSSYPINSVSSHSTTEYFDVLPSFQMFQSILKRDNSQFSENLTGRPPGYNDSVNSRPSLPPTSSSNENRPMEYSLDSNLNSLGLGDHPLLPGEEINNIHDIPQSEHLRTEASTTATSETYGHTVLDNIDRLPKTHSSPISIQIIVTKDVAQPHLPANNETRLKEYSSGDMVNGYILITNNSDKPVDFGLFIVTLEGTIKATERSPNANSYGRIRKMLTKKILKMYDLNASYSYTLVPSSTAVEYKAFSIDKHDGSILGLPDERILQPLTTYKKFFNFRFPEKLLDNVCMNSVLSHILPPPSMGFDTTCFSNRGTTVALNKTLGYGFLNVRGTPVLTRDYAFDDVSISYTIEAKFIDKLNSKNEGFSHHDINDSTKDEDYVVSASSQYFLRFIPNLSRQLPYYNLDFHYGSGTYDELGIDGKLFQSYLNMNSWRYINELNYQLEREIDNKLLEQELEDSQIKKKNLMFNSTARTSAHKHNLIMKDKFLQNMSNLTEPLEPGDNHYYYNFKMIGSSRYHDIWGKKKKKILSSLIKIGSSKLFVKVPNEMISYGSPKILSNYNNGSMNVTTNSLTPSSSPVSTGGSTNPPIIHTNISEIYSREADHKVRITLVFKPVDENNLPPKIAYIETNIVAWSYNTDFPLPVHLGYDFFHCDPRNEKVYTNTDDVQITRDNIQQLKDQAFDYSDFLKSNKTEISRESQLYLESLKSLSAKKDTIREYFAPITEKSHSDLLNGEGSWEFIQGKKRQITYVKTIEYPLHTINKHNVTLIPSFQTCLVGRIYCLQVLVKYKGTPSSDSKEFTDNILKVDVPILVG